MSKKSKIVEMGKDAFLALLENNTQSEVARQFGYLNSDGTGNGGVISNLLAELGWRESNGGNRKHGTRKPKGFLPKRVENWAIGKLGLDVAEGDLLPDGFGPDDFLALPDVKQETVNYTRLLSKLCPEKEAPALRAWLGCGLTIAEREHERLEALSKGAGKKVAGFLAKALKAAESFDSALADEIAALMTVHGFVIEPAGSEE